MRQSNNIKMRRPRAVALVCLIVLQGYLSAAAKKDAVDMAVGGKRQKFVRREQEELAPGVEALADLDTVEEAGKLDVAAEEGGSSGFQHMSRAGMTFLTQEFSADASGLGLLCEEEYYSGHSRPGSPRVAGIEVKLTKPEPTVMAFGDRLLKAAEVTDAMRACKSFFSFGDYTWCDKAMPMESSFARQNIYGGKSCNVTGVSPAELLETTENRSSNDDGHFEGLSFGIELADAWSELMSSMYLTHTRLYDCYVTGTRGPMFTDMHGSHDKENPCNQTHCYTMPYEKNSECIDRKNQRVDNRTYKSLNDYLNGRAVLSTFVKMDVEGSEWGVLEDLLNNANDLAKIRTLDMEVHMNFMTSEMPDRDKRMEHRVSIMERMAKQFAVTGSTIALEAGCEAKHLEAKAGVVPYTSAGFSMNQYCISFVNRALL